MAHQFVKGGSICESEEVSIGGVDQVSADYFENFDYVGLGHLHGPQTIGRKLYDMQEPLLSILFLRLIIRNQHLFLILRRRATLK